MSTAVLSLLLFTGIQITVLGGGGDVQYVCCCFFYLSKTNFNPRKPYNCFFHFSFFFFKSSCMQANLHEEMFHSWCAFFTQGLPLDLFVAFQKGLLSRCSTKAKPAARTYNCNDTEDAHPPVANTYYVFWTQCERCQRDTLLSRQ